MNSKLSSPELMNHRDTVSTVLVEICERSAFLIDQMRDGERTTITKLASDVGNSLMRPLPGDKVLPVVRFFVERCPGIVVLRGSTGGLFKGFRPSKTDKTE